MHNPFNHELDEDIARLMMEVLYEEARKTKKPNKNQQKYILTLQNFLKVREVNDFFDEVRLAESWLTDGVDDLCKVYFEYHYLENNCNGLDFSKGTNDLFFRYLFLSRKQNTSKLHELETTINDMGQKDPSLIISQYGECINELDASKFEARLRRRGREHFLTVDLIEKSVAPKDRVRVYDELTIQVRGKFIIESETRFEKCKILFNDARNANESFCRMFVQADITTYFNNCSITNAYCQSLEHPSIVARFGSSLIFTDCIFTDCKHLLELDSCYEYSSENIIIFKNCRFVNCKLLGNFNKYNKPQYEKCTFDKCKEEDVFKLKRVELW